MINRLTPKHFALIAGMALCVTSANAQILREEYITIGGGSESFHTMIGNWTPGGQVSEDDNFYISRVKPHTRFRNTATQVRQDLTESNDKKLVAWIPINEPTFNALPDGQFDTEVFSMWSYVTHFGDWTAPQGRVPGAFSDVAHKNGVGVSGVASIPYGSISSSYKTMLQELVKTDVDNDAKFMRYYGIDGLGYNSEFSTQASIVTNLQKFHGSLVEKMRETNPLFENFWYDGTTSYGTIMFDQGLAGHNRGNMADNDGNPRSSLFLNYNWNSTTLLQKCITNASTYKVDPLNLYAGVNMQGGQPTYNNWPLLKNYSISIGLWGAHSNNMFWESRGEKGSNVAVKQNTYLMRTERYFTGGTRNPANCPEVTNAMSYSADNYTWHGMSSFMTARSALSWDLSEEPFITYFNIGNGTYFNLKGVQQNNREWYNIGMQDYLPTWRWWFASKLLGREATDVPATGLDANVTWDDAYFGGSTIAITGSTSDEYLHLFKTEYALKTGDVITFRYKLAGGTADMDLVLSAKGSESTGVSYDLLASSTRADDEEWIEKTFTVGSDFNGKDLALVALHFTNAQNLKLYLGEFSIVRGTAATPAQPTLTSTKMLYNSKSGYDAKVIFNMPNTKAAGEPCYNLDVQTSYFNIYTQEEGQDAVLMTTTTSWAAFVFAAPVVNTPTAKMRIGVSAVSLDHKSESAIAWSDYLEPTAYTYSDDIQIDKTTIKPNEKFTLSYVDPLHEDGTWELYNEAGTKVYTGTGRSVTVENGMPTTGDYTLKLTGKMMSETGSTTTREFLSYVQVSGESTGALPEIYTLTANGSTEPITIKVGDAVNMAYTARSADGVGSRGINLNEKRFGAKCADLGVVGQKSFSVSFWVKFNKLASGQPTQLLSVANKLDSWPKTDWGWLWCNVNDNGSLETCTWRGTDASNNDELQYKYDNTTLPIGTWVHVAMTFDYNTSGNFHSDLYVNGEKQSVVTWKRTQAGTNGTGDPGYQARVYQITDGQVLAVGGDAHSRAGIDGALDNLMVWDGVMTADEVKTSMGDVNASNLPSNVISFWSFEDEPNSEGTFASAGSKTVQAGSHTYASGENEGQGYLKWETSLYTAGCPYLAGSYKVETLPTWRAPKATITNATGNSSAGQATLTYEKEGDRTVTLTLTNALGSDQRTFNIIHIGGSTGVDGVETGDVKTYTVGEDAVIEFVEAGNYEVRVYNLNGQAEAAEAATVSAGQTMHVHLAQAGIYMVQVKKDGKQLRTVKLVRK